MSTPPLSSPPPLPVQYPDPKPDPRRSDDLFRELQQRAQTWLPNWQGIAAQADASARGDFGRAFLQIAARTNAEVTQRLNQTPNKAALAMLDWLAIAARPGKAAHMPVVLKARANGKHTVFAKAPLKFQVNTSSAPIPFESNLDIRVVPGSLICASALDASEDKLYQAPPSLLRLEAPSALPTRWVIKSVVGENSIYDRLQLDPPELGLDAKLWLQIGDAQYRIVEKAQGGLVKITPELPVNALPKKDQLVRLVQSFAPFSDKARDLEAHYLYIGDENALNLTAPASIHLLGVQELYGKCSWQYWGKLEKDADPAWLTLTAEVAQTEGVASLQLTKPKCHSTEIIEVAGRNSRWLRALADPSQIEECAQTFEGVQLKIQSTGGKPEDLPTLEAVSNSTSIVLNERFYPFGKTPRQFDSFYLACKEVFSKSGAEVTLTADIAGRTLGPLVGWRSSGTAIDVAAAGKDGSLHILRATPNESPPNASSQLDWTLRASLAPSSASAETDASDAVGRFSGFSAQFAPATILTDFYGSNLMLCLPAGRDVWAWSEPSGSKWSWLGSPSDVIEPSDKDDAVDAADVQQLICTGRIHWDSGASLLALLDGGKTVATRLFYQASRSWSAVEEMDDTEWASITPLLQVRAVNDDDDSAQYGAVDRAVLLAADGSSIGILQSSEGIWRLVGKLACPEHWTGKRTPLAWQWRNGNQNQIFIGLVLPREVGGNGNDMLAIAAWNNLTGDLDTPTNAAFSYTVDSGGSVVGDAPSLALSGQEFDYSTTPMWLACSVRASNSSVNIAWCSVPKHAGSTELAMQNDAALPPGTPDQSPIFVGTNLIVPGNNQDLMSDGFTPFRLRSISELASRVGNGLVPDEALFACDWIQWDPSQARLWAYGSSAPVVEAERPWVVWPAVADGNRGRTFDLNADTKISKAELIEPDVLCIPIQEPAPSIELALILLSTDGESRAYRVDISSVEIKDGPQGHPMHHIRLNTELNETGFWDAYVVDSAGDTQFDYTQQAGIWYSANDLAEQTSLHDMSESANPLEQRISRVISQSQNLGGSLLLFNTLWSRLPAADADGKANFSSDPGGTSRWRPYVLASNAKPDLSWEYWNGTGWWKIDGTIDRTADLRQSGKIEFTVPSDLGQTDVLGRQNFWIRARLIGGDYGRESITLSAQDPTSGIPATVTTSTENINAPQIITLKISYQLKTAIWPSTVLTQDTLSWLDQSLANRSPGASVSVFTPSQQRLAAMGAQRVGRSLFLALQNKPESGPVRIFFKVEEADLSICAPLKVEALADGRLVPVLADDDTRALGESGLLTLQFDQTPTQSELFGLTAYWLRLYPSAEDARWTPTLQGAYLNAVWAEAAQGRSMEVLGSSNAAPNQSVQLVGAPVLAGSLELRVAETLGTQERATLLAQGLLVSDPPGFPGDWVLWQEVADPADEASTARVYAMDASSGMIRFGDGQHGAVPPLGRNNIVAFAWRRGGDAAANGLRPFTAVNLVGPIEGVEGAFNPDIATGGALPESAAAVANFAPARLRMRERIITLRDLEQATLDFSDEWVQARALKRGNRVALVGVARGENPIPAQAQRRALASYLAAHADPLLAQRVDVRTPRLWPFGLALKLTVASLDATGNVGLQIEAALARWFDSAIGGAQRSGIPLGAPLEADDIAYALLEIDDLESLDQIKVQLMDADHQITDEQARADLPDDALPRLISLTLKFTVSNQGVA